MFNVFLEFDDLFNQQGFVTPQQWIDLDLFDIDSTGVVLGPFPDCHPDHLLGPGSIITMGIVENAQLAVSLYDLIVLDPNFPNHVHDPVHPSAFDAPKTFHHPPRPIGI